MGLQNIPKHLYEAAALEGATEWQMFRRITLPLLRPVMVFVLVTSVTGSFQIFGSCQAICRQKRSAQRGFLGIGAGSGASGLR